MEGLDAAPAVFLNGPRQCGKTTLATRVAKDIGAEYLSFDEAAVLAAAEADPVAFVADLETPVVIDEAQLVPGRRLHRPHRAFEIGVELTSPSASMATLSPV